MRWGRWCRGCGWSRSSGRTVAKGARGRPPVGIERMLRIYFLQQWHGLADEAPGDAIYDSQAMRTFAGIDPDAEPVPDATTGEAEGNREAGGRASRCSTSGICLKRTI